MIQCLSTKTTQVQELLSPFPDLLWLALRPQLRPLLTNLKVLDWFARSSLRSRQVPTITQFFGLASVIDQLWGQWTESPADGLARSHLLMKLATSEAETLSRGVPRTQLDSSEQRRCPAANNRGSSTFATSASPSRMTFLATGRG